MDNFVGQVNGDKYEGEWNDDRRHGQGPSHPGAELRANLKPISHECHLFDVAFVWELTKETIDLPLGCLQGGSEQR